VTDISALIAATAPDQEIQDRVNLLFHRILDEAEALIVRGSTATKIRMIPTALPAMMSFMKQEDGAAMAEIRGMLMEMHAEQRQALFPQTPPSLDPP